MADTKLTELASGIPAFSDYEYFVDDPAGVPVSKRNYVGAKSALSGVGALSTDAAATDTAVAVHGLPASVAEELFWVVIDAHTAECEVRKVTGVVSTTLSFTGALGYTHSANDVVLFVDSPALNVKWFGATGDGTTDDTAAIAAAVTQAAALDGVVSLPAGTYAVTGVTLDSEVTLEGEGYITVIQNSATNAAAIQASEKTNLSIRNLRVYGGAASPGTSHRGINFEDCTGVLIENVWAHGFQVQGIRVAGYKDTDPGSSRVIINNCNSYNNGYAGIWAIYGGEHYLISGNHCYKNGVSGIVFDDSSTGTSRGKIVGQNYIVIDGNICDDNTRSGIAIEGSSHAIISNNVCSNNGRNAYWGTAQLGNGIILHSAQNFLSPQSCVVTSNICMNNRVSGIKLVGSAYCLVSDNICKDNGYGSSSAAGVQLSVQEIEPEYVYHYDDSGSSYTELANAYDSDTDTESILTLAAADYIYVGVPSPNVTALEFDFGAAVNANAAEITVETYNGAAWVSVGVTTSTDGTYSGTETFSQDGVISWDLVESIEQVARNGLTAYWFRLTPSALLTASVAIKEIYAYHGACRNLIYNNFIQRMDTGSTQSSGMWLEDTYCQLNNIDKNTLLNYTADAWNPLISPAGDYTLFGINDGMDDVPDVSFLEDDPTPSVKTRRAMYRVLNTDAQNITFLDDGLKDQVVTMHFTNNNTQLVDGATFNLDGGGNKTPDDGDTVTMIKRGDNWYEISNTST